MQPGPPRRGIPGPRKSCGSFRREISYGGRIFWKSRLLFYCLPADFQQVLSWRTSPGKSNCGEVEIFWLWARLTEYSAMGLESLGCHQRKLGLLGGVNDEDFEVVVGCGVDCSSVGSTAG